MFSKVQPFLLQALSSVHAGSGNEIGLVDNPIQRETHTGYPKIESSSLKGAIRSTVEECVENGGNFEVAKDVYRIFGNPPIERDNLQAGAIAFADARLLLFPIKSMRGIFTYVTCPSIIQRFNHEMESFVINFEKLNDVFSLPVPEANTVSSERVLVGNKKNIVLGEYSIAVSVNEKTKELAEILESIICPEDKGMISDRFVVLADDDFADFVRLYTEINARIRINPETGTVDEGALFYEENVPVETVFYSFLFVGKIRAEKPLDNEKTPEEILSLFHNEDYFPAVFQLGGNSTLGRGMLKRIWLEKGE